VIFSCFLLQYPFHFTLEQIQSVIYQIMDCLEAEQWFDPSVDFDTLYFDFETVVTSPTPRPLFDMREKFTLNFYLLTQHFT